MLLLNDLILDDLSISDLRLFFTWDLIMQLLNTGHKKQTLQTYARHKVTLRKLVGEKKEKKIRLLIMSILTNERSESAC